MSVLQFLLVFCHNDVELPDFCVVCLAYNNLWHPQRVLWLEPLAAGCWDSHNDSQ